MMDVLIWATENNDMEIKMPKVNLSSLRGQIETKMTKDAINL